jgi:hypothetical protein
MDEKKQSFIPDKANGLPLGVDCDIYLYDGPPDVSPNGVKMVAFISPNHGWQRSMMKIEDHVKLYMPNWDLNELFHVSKALALNIYDDEIKKRFALIGGAARYCLSQSEEFITEGETLIEAALCRINGYDQLRDCFNGNPDKDMIVHCLMHYMPEDNVSFAKLVPASEDINSKLLGRLETKLQDKRQVLMHWLDRSDKGSVLFGWLFENFVYECFLKGGQFQMRSLTDSSYTSIDIDPTVGQFSRFNINSSQTEVTEIFRNIYCLSESKNCASVDSYILTETTIFMFQITKSVCHPVKESGLTKLLESLSLLDLVPQNMEKNHRQQKFSNLSFTKVSGNSLHKKQQLSDGRYKNTIQLVEVFKQDYQKKTICEQLS